MNTSAKYLDEGSIQQFAMKVQGQPQEYGRTMGTFKPYFEGKPDDYWQTTWGDIFTSIGLLCLVIAFFVALAYACVQWTIEQSSHQFALVVGVLVCFCIMVFLILSFYISKDKKQKEIQVLRKAKHNYQIRYRNQNDIPKQKITYETIKMQRRMHID